MLHFTSMTYTPKTFNLPKLEGISEKQIKVHLALYEGYVKHVNLIMTMSRMYGNTVLPVGSMTVRSRYRIVISR